MAMPSLGFSRSRSLTFIGAAAAGLAIVGAVAVIAQTGDSAKREPARDLPGPAFAEEPAPPGKPAGSVGEPTVYGGFLVHPGGLDPAEDEPAVAFARWDGWTFEERSIDEKQVSEYLGLVGLRADALALPGDYRFANGGVGIWTAPDGTVEAQGVSVTFDDGRHPPVSIHRGRSHYYTSLGLFPFAVPNLPNHEATLGKVGGRPAILFHRKPGLPGRELQQVLFIDGDFVTTVEGYVDRFGTLVEIAERLASATTLGPGGIPAEKATAPVSYRGQDGQTHTAR